jgi:trimeric autotransporter adhesin
VPTSAVTTDGTAHSVQVLESGKPKTVPVGVGAVGPTWTEITRGLTAGQQVVLANLDAALPNSATNSSNGTTNRFGTKGFPGGGGFRGPND